MNYVVKDVVFTGYETDLNALQDLALGDGVRLDAVLTALPTGAGVIKDGLPLKQLGNPVYFEYLAAAFDKASSKSSIPLAQKVSEILKAMHADGTLIRFSQMHYGLDLIGAAEKYDLSMLKQW